MDRYFFAKVRGISDWRAMALNEINSFKCLSCDNYDECCNVEFDSYWTIKPVFDTAQRAKLLRR